MKRQKKSYSRPVVSVVRLIAEYGIAASSVNVSGGSSGTPHQPTVEDWEVGGSGYWTTDL